MKKIEHNQPPPDPKVTNEKYEFRHLKIRSRLNFICDTEETKKRIMNAGKFYAWYHNWKFLYDWNDKKQILTVYREG